MKLMTFPPAADNSEHKTESYSSSNCKLEYSEKRVQLYHAIKEFIEAGYSKRHIGKLLNCSRNTVSKYVNGHYEAICRTDYRSGLDKHYDYIVKSLESGMCRKDIYDHIVFGGFKVGRTAAYEYMNKIAARNNIELTLRRSLSPESIAKKKKLQKYDHLTRGDVFRFLWMDVQLPLKHIHYLMTTYPVIQQLHNCIMEFRTTFKLKRLPMLHLFIERYKKSDIKEVASFVIGLEKDIDAVENAVSCTLSNGFVEGCNNKLKMIKRTMYGRCSRNLLEAKLLYSPL